MADASTKVVYAALVGNVLVAASKFGAALLSGSSAMLTEAIHSSADITNQIVLLIGNKRSRAAPDPSHPFGYGMEVYFWTVVVAVIVLLAGGAASIWEGVRQIASPQPIRSPYLSFGVLALSAIFEGASLAVGYHEYKRQVRGRRIDGEEVSMWRFIEVSKDPNLYESLLEDSAALIGIVFAAIGLLASVYLGALWADGAASIAIGLLLIADSFVIATATRSLIAGEAVTAPVLDNLRGLMQAHPQGGRIADIKTLHLGPRSILVALTIRLPDDAGSADSPHALVDLMRSIKGLDGRIDYVYFTLEAASPAPSPPSSISAPSSPR